MRSNTKVRRRSGLGGAQSPTGAGTSGSPGLNAEADADAALAKDKAQARRAQVRKAQIQHRQRKANYVKQLEMDVARIRETIEAAERDTRALLDENKAMRAQILQTAGAGSTAMPLSLNRGVELLREMPLPTELTSEVGVDMQSVSTGVVPGEQGGGAGRRSSGTGVTVTLGFDEVMNAPTFYISSPVSPKGSQLPLGPLSPPQQESETETGTSPNDDLPDLTPSQSQAAINFILAYVCSLLQVSSHLPSLNHHPKPNNPQYSLPQYNTGFYYPDPEILHTNHQGVFQPVT